jgi:hypothetical protein
MATLFTGQTEDPGLWELRVVEGRTDAGGQRVLTGSGDIPAALRESVSVQGAPHARLKASVVEDMILVCVYGLS